MTDITDEMVTKGAAAISDLLTMLGINPDERTEHNDAPSVAVQLAELVLAGGLAGCAVVDLPQADRREDECGVMAAFWHLKHPGPGSEVTDVMSYAIDGDPVVYTGPGPEFMYSVEAMRERCLAGLAACDDAERLAAAQSSGVGGDTR